MPAIVPPLEQEAFARMREGDEQVLERFYRERFESLNEKANAELQHPAASARVVEKAVLAAWHRRAEFETPAALDTFLDDAIHQGAIREKKRLATIHRFESHEGKGKAAAGHGGPPTADEAWKRLSALVHPAPDAEKTGYALKAQQRHDAAHHIGDVARQGSRTKAIGGVVAILLVVGGFVGFMFKVSGARAVSRALSMPDIRQTATKEGQVGNITLDDGTIVRLGAQSKIRIPARFNELFRAVGLSGTATFTVAPNPSLPFEVRAGDMAIVAKGTKFDVRADSGSGAVTLRVREGSVEAKTAEDRRTLTQGQAVTAGADKKMADLAGAKLDETLGWTDGRFVMNDHTLREVLDAARRFYGLRFDVRGAGLLDKKISVESPIDSTKALIAALERNGLYFSWDRSVMVLSDSSLAPKTPPKPAAKAAARSSAKKKR